MFFSAPDSGVLKNSSRVIFTTLPCPLSVLAFTLSNRSVDTWQISRQGFSSRAGGKLKRVTPPQRFGAL